MYSPAARLKVWLPAELDHQDSTWAPLALKSAKDARKSLSSGLPFVASCTVPCDPSVNEYSWVSSDWVILPCATPPKGNPVGLGLAGEIPSSPTPYCPRDAP